MNATVKAADMPVQDWPVIGFIVAVHLLALSALAPMTFSWPAVGVARFLHWVTTGVGVTLGYHRLITHRSFQVPKWVEYGLLFCGTLLANRPSNGWLSTSCTTAFRTLPKTLTTLTKASGGRMWAGFFTNCPATI